MDEVLSNIIPIADLTTYAAKPGEDRYFIVFAARGGHIVGHAFVIWGTWSYDRKVCSYKAYGFYADSSITGAASLLFGPVPGHILDDALPQVSDQTSVDLITDRLILEVPDYVDTVTEYVLKGMSTNARPYQMDSNDCETFVQAIADRIGLQTPGRVYFEFPQQYIQQLRETATRIQHNEYFDGPMISGLPAGPGVWKLHDGSTWTGGMAGLEMNGPGTFRLAGQYVFTGIAAHNKFHGQGKVVFDDGDKYEGSFIDSDFSGQGKYVKPDGTTWEGEFANGHLLHGRCTVGGSGNVYEGNFKNNKLEGVGKVYFRNGHTWEGNFVNGDANGLGTYTVDGRSFPFSYTNGYPQASHPWAGDGNAGIISPAPAPIGGINVPGDPVTVISHP